MTAAELKGEHAKVGAMHELFAPCVLMDEHTVLTKRQDLFSVLRVEGIDAECLDPEEIGRICQRFESALRMLGTEYRIYQYLIKRNCRGLSAPTVERTAWLESRRLYSIDLYIVLLRMRPLLHGAVRSLAARFSTREVLHVSLREIRREVDMLASAVGSLVIQLQDAVRPAVLDQTEIMAFLRNLANCEPWRAVLVQDFHVDQQMTQAGIECWPNHLKQGDQYIKVLSLTEPPSQTFANMLRPLLDVGCEFVIASEWRRESNLEARRVIEAKRRHFHFAKTSIMSYFGNSNPRPDEVLIDDSKTAVVDELNQALRAMEVEENHFGRFSLTVALHDPDSACIKRCAAKVAEVFATHDAKVVDETYNMLNAWLAMVPGNYTQNHRQLWLLNTNYGDMSFLFRPAAGARVNTHLERPALNVVETRQSTAYSLNLHVEDVGHTCVLGSTGSGKSFLVNFLTDSYQQYQPYTIIFDLGGSYRRLTAKYAGGYLHVGKESSFTFNPFRLANTPENLDFLFAFVRVLIERDYTMSSEDRKDLHRAIGEMYVLDVPVRRLSTLAQIAKRSYAPQLAEWTGQGRLAGYFDHADDTLSFTRFQAFDFEGMDQPDVLEPLLFYILHRANASIYDQAQGGTPKLFVFDEAWRFFRNSITRTYIHEALKTWRKRNAAVIMATQSSDDLQRSELLPVIVESCMSKIFLASPGIDLASYRETFHLNQTEAGLIAGLVPKQQFLLKQPGGSKVLNLNVDPHSSRIYGNQL
jgi:type IV secretion/conjugal transfer VirB4 family ATPase